MTARKLTDVQWQDIRAAYEGDNPNVSALAAQFGVSRALLHRRARIQAWVKGGAPSPREFRKPDPAASSSRVLQGATDGATGFGRAVQTRVILSHQVECRRLGELIWDAVDTLPPVSLYEENTKRRRGAEQDHLSALAREKRAKARLDTLHGLAQVLATKQRSEREAYRIDPKMVPEPEPAAAERTARAIAFSQKVLRLMRVAKHHGVDLAPFSDLFSAEGPKAPSEP